MNLNRVISDLAASGTSTDVFSELEKAMTPILGKRIFSCSTFDLEAEISKRIFTNQPEVYPLSGTKRIIPNHWTRTVLDNKQHFVGNTIEELKEVFPDADVIASLGAGSTTNLRVVFGKKLLGTVNLTDVEGAATPDRVEAALDYLWIAQIGFLMALAEAQSQDHQKI